jgi:hypothetical protein
VEEGPSIERFKLLWLSVTSKKHPSMDTNILAIEAKIGHVLVTSKKHPWIEIAKFFARKLFHCTRSDIEHENTLLAIAIRARCLNLPSWMQESSPVY